MKIPTHFLKEIILANSNQARKRIRQTNKRRVHNKSRSSRMRTAIKQVIMAIEAKDKTKASELYVKMTSILDNAAQNGLIHVNKAARHKRRLNSHIKAL